MSLPDTYRDEWDMARTLASYIDCPHRIRREIGQTFGRVPSLDSVRKLRAQHLHPRQKGEAYRRHEIYDAAAESRALDPVNCHFVDALRRERGL